MTASRISEEHAGCGLSLALLAAAFYLGCAVRRLRRINTLRGLCREYALANPKDQNALETALELENSTAPLTPFQREYLSELQGRFLGGGKAEFLSCPAWRPRWRLPYLALAFAGLFLLGNRGRESWSRWRNFLWGEPAICLEALPEEIPVHQDVVIAARVLRYGTEEGVFLESASAGIRRLEAMSCAEDGIWKLTCFDLTEKTAFRVRTKHAVSGWHRIAPYLPPKPADILLTAIPPAYTRLETRTFSEFRDLELHEGEEVRIECRMPSGQRWQLCREGRAPLFPPVAFLPEEGCLYTPQFSDGRHTVDGASFRVSVQPDQPPVIEQISPEEDQTITPEEKPSLAAVISDDYGVAEVVLHYIIDDGKERRAVLWQGEAPLETLDLVQTLDFGVLEAGQLVTGWLEAEDNCEPDAHSARGPLFFLTVLPAPDEMLSSKDNGQDSGEKHELTVEDLIVESKRLLRSTMDLLERGKFLPSERIYQERQDLSRDLRSLSTAITGRQIAVAKNAGLEELPSEMASFFQSASQSVAQAGDLVERGMAEESRPLQQSALAQLSKLSWILLQNTRMESNSSSGESRNQGEGKEGKEESQSRKGDRNFDLQQLQNALTELRGIRREEQALLPEMKCEDAAVQRGLATRVSAVGGQVAAIASASGAVAPIRESARELVGAAGALEGQELANAALRGERAIQQMLVAEELLQEALRKESREQMANLARQAEELAKEQRALAEESQALARKTQVTPQEKQHAKEAQNALQEKTRRFRQDSTQTLQNLAGQFPQAAEGLTQAMRSPSAEKLQKAQTKAQNALLYGKYGRASQSQEDAAKAMEEWRDELAAANDLLPQYTPEELQQALAELQRQADGLAHALSAEEAARLQHEAAESLKEYGRQFHSSEMQGFGDAAMSGNPEEAFSALQNARQFLRQELARMLGESAAQTLKRSALPPKKYRPQAQEYFRRLGN